MTAVHRVLCRLALGLGVLVSAGCLKRETAVQRGNREQVLHRGIGYEVTELDPHLVTGVAEGMRASMDEYLSKPIDSQRMSEIIGEILRRGSTGEQRSLLL